MPNDSYYTIKDIDNKSELLRIENFDKHNGFNDINIINSVSVLLSKSNYTIIKVKDV